MKEKKPGLKLRPDKVKAGKVGGLSNKVKVWLMLIAVVAGVLVISFISRMGSDDVVSVVKLSAAVPQDGRITEENMVEDSMTKTEYEKQGIYTLSDGSKKRSIVLWSDRSRIVNAYASYYIRQGTPIYWDSLSKETPKKYSYLYKMDGELAKIDLDAEEFGKMLVPGDKINVRASYTQSVYTLPDEKDFMIQQQTGIQAQTTETKQDMLFNNATVLDMLNADGDSIFDMYYQLLALPKAKQQAMVQTEEFQEKVKPSKILLNVTTEEADNYMLMKSKSPTYMMTLLPRTSGNLITEALNELQIGFARTTN